MGNWKIVDFPSMTLIVRKKKECRKECQYTIGIIYDVPTSSSDNPLTRKRSVFSVRPRMSQNSLLAVVPSPFTCVDYGGCYGV